MLHQISWFTYAVSIITLISIYYLYVAFTYYRAELQTVSLRLTGKARKPTVAGAGDLQIPDDEIMGKAQPAEVDFVRQQELTFAPADEAEAGQAANTGANSRLIGYFSEMISEVKTLIRVINESSETKENFEMLFRLIIQKYQPLTGTPYQQQINDFLLAEGATEFPFPLTETDINNYWIEER